MLEQRLRQPRRELSKRIAWCVFEASQLNRVVAPDGFDEWRARTMAGGGDVSHERRGFERDAAARQRADDEQPLSGAEIEADANGELTVLAQSSVEVA